MTFDWPDPVVRAESAEALDEAVRGVARRTADVTGRRAAAILPGHLAHYAAGKVMTECPICPGPAYDGTYTVDGFKLDACRTCSAPIVWATTEDGKSMPVDGPLTPDGNVVLSRPPAPVTTDKVYAVVLDQDSLFGDGPRRVSHFATCPDAAGWRRR